MKKIVIPDDLDFSIVKHFINGIMLEGITVHEDNTIVIPDKYYKLINQYLKKFKIQKRKYHGSDVNGKKI
ncbi:MAG: hypothetical protein WC136_02150 [Sphaerochaeta sp.]|jgi:hypothetical protein